MIRRYNPEETAEMAALLKQGGVLSVPTDTVYGLCALCDETGSRRLYEIKQRPLSKPLPLMCSDIAQAETVAIVDERARRIMEHLMPGPLTLILKKGPGAPGTLAGETAAIRLATSEPLRRLICAAGAPVYMTSANRSGERECGTLDEIELACPEIDGMMEGSVCFGQASTIADISNGTLNIVRQGPIQRETIEKVMEEGEIMIDPAIKAAVEAETLRQNNNIELIASENFCSKEVRELSGSILTNKYAEGYPGKRYYGGCVNVDVIEDLARTYAHELFGADHANVQPHSGSQANMGVYMSVLQTGDKVLGMDLAAGGHLTHGAKVSFSGKLYDFYSYGVDPNTERIDYDALKKTAKELSPKLIVAGASAYPRELDFKAFREIADACGALLMVDMAHIAGLVAGGNHMNPVPYADFVTTTTHKTLRGPRGGMILCKEQYAKAVDKAVFPGMQGGPLCHIVAAKAQCLYEAKQPAFKAYSAQIIKNCAVLADTLQKEGFRLVTGGTDNHLILVDVKNSVGITGRDAEQALDDVNITANKNAIPFDQEKPSTTSGIRLGTAAMTTKGFDEQDFRQVGLWISKVLHNKDDEALKASIKQEVLDLTASHPFE